MRNLRNREKEGAPPQPQLPVAMGAEAIEGSSIVPAESLEKAANAFTMEQTQ